MSDKAIVCQYMFAQRQIKLKSKNKDGMKMANVSPE